METINNVANIAAKAVWGEGEASKEPVSGVKGDVAKGEPYDAGNLDTPSQEKVELRLDNAGNKDAATNTTTTAATTSDKPAVVAAPPKADTSAEQNDTRHPDEVPDTLDPASITGPGPKPVDVVAREHGGDAGQAKKAAQGSESSAGFSGASKTQEDDASKGTGEGYVKATGFSADGGDFDAKNPGAGKEADRLIHEKHPNGETPASTTATQDHSPTQTNGSSKDSSPKSKHGKNKPSLSERIKAKFHRH